MAYPAFETQVNELVHEHVDANDEPVIVAIYYQSLLYPTDECVFEVIAEFGFGEISEQQIITTVQFGPSASFPMPPDGRLRLLLTNPAEFKAGFQGNWPVIADLRDAIGNNAFQILHFNRDSLDAVDVCAALGIAN